MVFILIVAIITSLLGALDGFTNVGPLPARASNTGTKFNVVDPRSLAAAPTHPMRVPSSASNPGSIPPPGQLLHPVPMPMTPGSVSLDPAKPAQFIGSDGRFEVDIPDGAVTPADLAAASGQLNLSVRQVAPASGGTGGGSGRYSFGTYLVQTVTAQKREWSEPLRKPLTFKLHVSSRELVFDLRSVTMAFNAAIPADVNFNPDPSGPVMTASQANLARSTSFKATFDLTNSALVTTTSMPADPIVTFNTDSPDASFGRPDLFNADLSAGALSTSYPIDVPAGPGGLNPPIQLAYNTAGVNEQHNPQGGAPWVGQGWSLNMGSISWAEHNVAAGCQRKGTCTNANWEDSWQLNDPFGTSAELIPPDYRDSTYYDDTAYSITPTPVQWRTAPDGHAKIFEYTGSFGLPGEPVNPPCYRVFLPTGIMEEFGCSTDNGVQPLQYWPWTNGGNYAVNQWLLDLITDPQGNQIHLNYQVDTSTYVNKSYPRDIVLQSIEWDSPGCHNAQTRCTGASWAPLMRVNFSASHSVAHVNGSGCAANGNLRCDDPVDLSGSNGQPNPRVQSTFVLNDIQVQVRPSGTSAWNLLRDYQLSYDESPQTTATESVLGTSMSVAGKLTLTQILGIGDDGVTALPARTFGYVNKTNWYTDEAYPAAPAAGCGPPWQTPSPCYQWSQSYGGNSWYLSSASNGLGLAQSFTYALAHNNTHGVNGGGPNTANPLYCNGLSGTPCSKTDSQVWSRIVLSQETGSVVQGGTTLTASKQYSYSLTYPLVAQACSDCVAGYSWGNQKDGDYADFYNGRFMGFAQVTVTNPDSGVEVHKFHSTLGYGVYDCTQVSCAADNGTGTTWCTSACHNDPWWPLSSQSILPAQNGIPINALHGREYEADYYDTNGTTLLKKTVKTYATGPNGVQCPPTGVVGEQNLPSPPPYGNWDGQLVSELDPSNPVAVCDIHISQVDNYINDGASAPGVPDHTTVYSYDSSGRVTTETDSSNDSGSSAATTTIVNRPAYIYNDNITATSTAVTGTYLINATAFTDSEDASGNRFSCAYTSYDGAAWASGQSASLTFGKATRVDRYSFCGTTQQTFNDRSGPITTTSSFDAYGNRITGNDADANAGSTAHLGCSVNGSTYSECLGYDATFLSLPISHGNALNQTEQTTYQAPASATAAGGFGMWPMSTTDVNSQVTSYAYDPLGRPTSQTLPNESAGLTTLSVAYTDWCSGTAAQSPCVEIDQTRRLNSSTTVTSRYFYDGWGHLVETRVPAPNNQDVIRYQEFDASGRLAAQSVAYFVAAYTGGPGSAAFSPIDTTQPVTSNTYDRLGRPNLRTDPLSHTTTYAMGVTCASVSGDSGCYEQTLTIDPLGHQTGALVDAFGRQDYAQRYSGNSSSTYAVYATSRYSYNPNGQQVEVAHPSSNPWPTSTPGVSDAGAASPGLPSGLYQINYTYVTSSGESAPSPPGWAALTSGHGISFAALTGIPAGVTNVRVYLTGVPPPATGGFVAALTVAGGSTPGYVAQGGGNGAMPPLATLSPHDTAGRKAATIDPDSGTTNYSYDQDSNLTQSVDPRGSTGTVYAGYDGLDRQLWRNSTNTSAGAFNTLIYDSTASGNMGVGRLTSETFTGGPNNSLSGSYTYVYDFRGQEITDTLTIGGASYPVQTSFDDAGNVVSQIYPTGEHVNTSYTPEGWISSVLTQSGISVARLLTGASYSGFGGAARRMTSGTIGFGRGTTYSFSATYDALARATDIKYTNGATLFDQSRAFDAAGNVTTANTTLPAGTDNQAFCYDEQDRLTWAGSAGTPPCGVSLTPGTLAAAQYTQSFGYDNLGRLTAGPLGAYTYGDTAHIHAATAIGSSYTAAYDAAGSMTCRAPLSSSTCSGVQTGAQLSPDAKGSLSAWQNTPSNPTVMAGFLYDGRGNRVEQQVTQNGTTTTTVYVGNLEQVATTGASTTTTTYYYAGAARIAEYVNPGTFSFLAQDALGTATVALNSSGSASAAILYAPYGAARYTNGTMPSDYGFTGQHSDSATGLDYYKARYYDPLAGQFASADTILPGNGYDVFGLSRYAYVEGNPISRIDASGHALCMAAGTGCGGSAVGPGTNGSGTPGSPGGSAAGASATVGLIGQHSCTGRCQIIMQLFDDANPPGDPLKQWYEQFLVPTALILTCLMDAGSTPCGGSGIPEANVLAWAEQGPGRLVLVNRNWDGKERGALFQEEKTGLPRDVEYFVNGYHFDGPGPGGILIDAKGPGYARFVGDDGKFQGWFVGSEGGQGMLKEAGNQIRAAPQGSPIVWLVAEERAQQAMIKFLSDNGFEGINVVYSPPGVNPWP